VASSRLVRVTAVVALAPIALVHCGAFDAAEEAPPITTDAQASDGTAPALDGPAPILDGTIVDVVEDASGKDAAPCIPPPTRLVFVTSTPFLADQGRKSADTQCQAEADAALLCGTFVAWLSMSGANAIDRLADAPYERIGGVRVFDNKAELIATGIRTPIKTASGGTPPMMLIWTGTKANGTVADKTCNGWTSSSGITEGTVGDVAVTGALGWSDRGFVSCNASMRAIVCFQQ
jgi:hypothetical protein